MKIKETQEKINQINDFRYRQLRRAPSDAFAKELYMFCVDLQTEDELSKWQKILRWQQGFVANKRRNNDDITEDDVAMAKNVDWELIVPEIVQSSNGRKLTQCLWHDDSNPSMVLYPNGKGGYCFVCNKGIDTIEYAMKSNGLDFIGAVKYLKGL